MVARSAPGRKEAKHMTISSLKSTKADTLAAVTALIAGTNKHFPNGSFTLGNVTYTTQSLVTLLQSLITAINAVNAAEAAAKDALSALQVNGTNVTPVLRAYRRFVLAAFSNASQVLADFGIAPPKVRTPLTAEQKAAAVAKMRATRKARGTTSKKQKLAILGNVTGVTVTPVTAPSSPATPAQPAPTASSEPTVAPTK
jgi:hypothetical protein